MGSLSDLRRTYISKESGPQGSAYLPYGSPALVGGSVIGATGGLLLTGSRRLPQRTQAARDRVAANAVTLDAQEARMAQRGGRRARQASQWADEGRERLARADRVNALAPKVQRSLRTKGGLMAAAGGGLAAYGAYARSANAQRGYS